MALYNILGSLGVSLAALPLLGACGGSSPDAVPELIALSRESNTALMRGDTVDWERLVKLGKDFTLMSPFGGEPSRAAEYTPERIARMGKFFRNGDLRMEVVQSYASPGMVVLALIERSHVEVGGLPPQEWALRVTLVYQRTDKGWSLVHRHADPLVEGVSLNEAAALARGEHRLAAP